MPGINLFVLSNPTVSYLTLLEGLPADTNILVGREVELFQRASAEAEVIINCNQPKELFQSVFNMCPKLRWVHSLSAGVESSMFPELIASPVPLTNGRGMFSRSLSEFVMGSALFFSKDMRRLVNQQEQGVWKPFDSEELAGKTMGIIGYGSIGATTAKLAKAFGMRVIAIRRKTSAPDDGLVDQMFSPSSLLRLMSESDYVVVSLPNTPTTKGFISKEAIAAMKPTAVIINVGRGAAIDEPALITALQHGQIRGASLDVFVQEPLPEGHAFYTMPNVLLSPHSADHVPGWIEGAMQFFVENFKRFAAGQTLENIVDKTAGY
jgi:phosphoglycerate dehydrogenase-like enzyme